MKNIDNLIELFIKADDNLSNFSSEKNNHSGSQEKEERNQLIRERNTRREAIFRMIEDNTTSSKYNLHFSTEKLTRITDPKTGKDYNFL